MSHTPSPASLNAQANARSAAKRHVLASRAYHNSGEGGEGLSKFSLLQSCGYSPAQIAFMSLQAAAKTLDSEKVSALLAAGVLVTVPDDEPGMISIKDRTPPLVIACRQKGPKAATIIEMLLKAGADVNAASASGGQTALHVASGGADSEVIDALLAGGADMSLRTQARRRASSPQSLSQPRVGASLSERASERAKVLAISLICRALSATAIWTTRSRTARRYGRRR